MELIKGCERGESDFATLFLLRQVGIPIAFAPEPHYYLRMAIELERIGAGNTGAK